MFNEKTSNTTAKPNPSSEEFDAVRGKGKKREVDLEKGGTSSHNASGVDIARRAIKQQYNETFNVSTHEEAYQHTHRDARRDASFPHDEQDKIVDWLKRDVLSVPPEREEKIARKVAEALEGQPVTARHLRDGLRAQEERDKRVATYGEMAVSMAEKVLGSSLYTAKKEIAARLNEPKARLARLEEEHTDEWLATNTTSERTALEQQIEQSIVDKAKITRVRIDALRKYQEYERVLNGTALPDEQKPEKLLTYAAQIDHSAKTQINAIKAARRSDLQKEELKKAQGHTTHGVGLGNLLHMGEMIPGYISLGLSAAAEAQTADVLKKQQ